MRANVNKVPISIIIIIYHWQGNISIVRMINIIPIKVGELGTVIHETSKILERRYGDHHIDCQHDIDHQHPDGIDQGHHHDHQGLSTDAVAKGLPLIDTKRTSISQHCPAFLMTPRCQLQRSDTEDAMNDQIQIEMNLHFLS